MQHPGFHGAAGDFMNSKFGYTNLVPPVPSSSQRDEDSYKRISGTRISNRTRACDNCRKRKTRCDGPRKADNICTNCLQNRKACTYVEASTPRGPPKSYVTGLEDKLEKMEAMLQRLRPGQDFSAELGPPVVRDSWKDSEPPFETSRSHSHPRVTTPSNLAPFLDQNMPTRMSSHLQLTPSTSSSSRAPSRLRQGSTTTNILDFSSLSKSDSSDLEELVDDFEKGMQRLTLRSGRSQLQESGPYDRFHGQSSYIKLVDATRKLRQAHIQSQKEGSNNTSSSNGSTASPSPEITNPSRRPEFWRAPKWELVYEGLHVDSPKFLNSVLETFPEPDLAEELIEHYFLHVNPQLCLLNKHIFYRQWRESLHERDIWFCALLMCIFALGSRWSNNSRVFARDPTKRGPHELDWSKAGWDYFNVAISIHRARRSLLCTATLFEVQTFSLLAWYLRGTPDYAVGGTLVTVGIRKAQDLGAHRKAVYGQYPTAEEELWKRAFWLLVILDRTGSASLGRPCSLCEEDYDLDLPLVVDDEFWESEDPALAFRQPVGLPSRVAAFNSWIGITQIVAFTLRTLYALDPKKFFLGRQTLPESEILIKQLNIALEEWFDSVPEHLQWPVPADDVIFSNQSASLHLSYHFAFILIYRTFIPFSQILPSDIRGRISRFSHKPLSLSTPALPICVKSAKMCVRIIEEQLRRGFSNVPFLITMCNVCTGILIVHLWDLKAKEMKEQERPVQISPPEDVKPQYALALQSVKEDIDVCLKALEWAKSRYSAAAHILGDLRASLPSIQYDQKTHQSSTTSTNNERSYSLWDWNSSEVPKNAPILSSWLRNNWGNSPHNNNAPLRTSSYSNPSAPFERPLSASLLSRRDSDPLLRQTPFWPTPVPSPSLSQLPANQSHSISNYSMSNRGSLPFISTTRRSSFTSTSAHPVHPRSAGSPSQNNSVYQANQDLNIFRQIPLSDARSIPNHSGNSTWPNDYHPGFPQGNDPPSYT